MECCTLQLYSNQWNTMVVLRVYHKNPYMVCTQVFCNSSPLLDTMDCYHQALQDEGSQPRSGARVDKSDHSLKCSDFPCTLRGHQTSNHSRKYTNPDITILDICYQMLKAPQIHQTLQAQVPICGWLMANPWLVPYWCVLKLWQRTKTKTGRRRKSCSKLKRPSGRWREIHHLLTTHILHLGQCLRLRGIAWETQAVMQTSMSCFSKIFR